MLIFLVEVTSVVWKSLRGHNENSSLGQTDNNAKFFLFCLMKPVFAANLVLPRYFTVTNDFALFAQCSWLRSPNIWIEETSNV